MSAVATRQPLTNSPLNEVSASYLVSVRMWSCESCLLGIQTQPQSDNLMKAHLPFIQFGVSQAVMMLGMCFHHCESVKQTGLGTLDYL